MTYDPWKWQDHFLVADLTAGEKVALLALQRHADRSGWCNPGTAVIAARCNQKRGVVKRALARAVQLGLLRRDGKLGRTTDYQLLMPRGGHAHDQGGSPAEPRGGHQQSYQGTDQLTDQERTKNGPKNGGGGREPTHPRDLNLVPVSKSVAPEHRIDTSKLKRQPNIITPTAHNMLWRSRVRKPWKGAWLPWLIHVLPYLSPAQHEEWITATVGAAGDPGLPWHTSVVKRILSGKPRRKQSGRSKGLPTITGADHIPTENSRL